MPIEARFSDGDVIRLDPEELESSSFREAGHVRVACKELGIDPVVAAPMTHIHNYIRLFGEVFELDSEEQEVLHEVLVITTMELCDSEEPDIQQMAIEQMTGFERMFTDPLYRDPMLGIYNKQILPWIESRGDQLD